MNDRLPTEQGSPTWCLRAPGRSQGPSRSPPGIGVTRVAKGGINPQISRISCRFVLWEALSQQNTVARLKSKYLVLRNFGLATLPPADCSKNNTSVISVLILRNILIFNTKLNNDKLSNILLQNCVSNWKLFALSRTQEVALGLKGWWFLTCGMTNNLQLNVKEVACIVTLMRTDI